MAISLTLVDKARTYAYPRSPKRLKQHPVAILTALVDSTPWIPQ